eukprot:CAMPEP_0170550228 /NCGR_PEP_ID=MMETSP0211-20121228/8304_1 /TAXON_ID=311385 /ORGANISM="Pseudokeronopsis sp., Strain OXSARD2" /LENGTH=61 /DNA_ID=CAMNT_0010856663 /DNA_START=136 /DNA_END=321 /DNA_ORIENTATION=+
MTVPLHLTQEEKKRLKRRKKLEKQNDIHTKVSLGLLPPPQPKIKLSNYMKILGAEAINNPS